MQVTVSLRAVACGTELNITQAGIPDLIPAKACYLGWRESLILLAELVEATAPPSSGAVRDALGFAETG